MKFVEFYHNEDTKKKAKRFKLLICVVFSVLGVMLIYFYSNNSSPFPNNVEVIEIQNGKTGKICSLEKTEAQEFLKKVSTFNFENDGIKGWTSGYTYRIKCTDSNKKIINIVVYGKNIVSKGIVKYNVDEDIIKLIQYYCEK